MTLLTARVIAEAARHGDALSIAAYHRAGEYLGIGVANFLHAFDPSIVIFGGGVSQVGPLLFDAFHASLKKRVFPPTLPRRSEDRDEPRSETMPACSARWLSRKSLSNPDKENVWNP